MSALQSQIIAILPKLRRFAYSLTGNAADGDDLLQNTVERVLKKKHSYDPSKKLDNWIFTIARNIWIDEIRARNRRGISVNIDDQYDLKGSDGVKVSEQKLLTEQVLKAMAKLPENQHQVAYYVLVEGNSYKEAADILNLPIGTIMSTLSRARQSLSATMFGSKTNGTES